MTRRPSLVRSVVQAAILTPLVVGLVVLIYTSSFRGTRYAR